MSNSVRPHRRQPNRLPSPWDSPGKNNGVGCHFLLQFMKVKSESEVAQSCPTLHYLMDCSLPGSSVHGIFQARVLESVAIAFSYCLIYMPKNEYVFSSWWEVLGSILLTTFKYTIKQCWGLPGDSGGKESACNVWDLGSIPGSGRYPGGEMATHLSILAWRIPWTEEPGEFQSMGLQRVRHDWATNTFIKQC